MGWFSGEELLKGEVSVLVDFDENIQLVAHDVPEISELFHEEQVVHAFLVSELFFRVFEKVLNGGDVLSGSQHGSVLGM